MRHYLLYLLLFVSGLTSAQNVHFDSLKAANIATGGGIATFNGRSASAAVPVSGDYTAAQVTNALDATGSYSNPSWLTGLAFSKVSGTPTSLSGYGITDPVVLTSGSYSNPSWITGLAWSKISGTPTTISGYGISDAVSLAGTNTWTGVNSFAPVSTLSAGNGNGLQLFPQFTQTSTSTYNGLYLSLYDNGTSSGNKYLLNMGTNTAALNGGTYTSKFSVTTAGAATLSSSLTLGGGFSGTSGTFSSTLGVTGVGTFTAKDVHNGGININGKQTIKRTTVADAAYTTLSTDYVIAYTTLTATRAVTLASGSAGDVLIVADESGNAGSFPITFVGTIDGATNKSISSAYGVMRLYCITGTTYKSF